MQDHASLDRRRLLFHGFALLTVAFALGLVAGGFGATRHPHARLWLGAHLTGILMGLMLLGFGLARTHLVLGGRGAFVYTWSLLATSWVGMAVLGVFSAACGIGSPIVAPQLPPATGWKAALVTATLAFVTLTTFATCLAGLWGARLRKETALAAAPR